MDWLRPADRSGRLSTGPGRAGAILNTRDIEGQRLLQSCIEDREFDPDEDPAPYLPDFQIFAETVLGWSFSPKGYAGTDEEPIPTDLEVVLPDYGDTLRPDFAVRELEPQEGDPPWQLLVRVSRRAKTSIARYEGMGAWKPRRMAGWNDCFAILKCPRVCSSMVALYVSSPRHEAKVLVGWT